MSQPGYRLTRRAALLLPWVAVAACGGGGSSPPAPDSPPPPAPPPGPPVDGPAWNGFARDAQHSGVSGIAAQPLDRIHWSAAVDLAPPYSGSGALLAHYGSPVISRRNTVVMPVRTGRSNAFVIEARDGHHGALRWSMPTAWRPPPANWLPTLNPLITADGRLVAPTSGGRLLVRADTDTEAAAVDVVTFYGGAAYEADPAAWDASVFVATPLTGDAAGNVFFGCSVVGSNPLGIAGGFVRLGADGGVRFVAAATAAGDAAMVKPATNAAPALSPDERVLYVVVNDVPASGARATGRLVALDAATLAPIASAALLDPLSGTPAWVNDNATSSPTIGPDGDVYIGVLEASGVSHNFRGWLLHFDATLAERRIPGSFGWDATAGIVPRSMRPGYAGTSPYLIAIKSNSYGGIGTGDGLHRVAILDPFAAETDRWSTAAVMREVISVLGPTPDPGYPGGVREWCINTMAIDPATDSILMNSEDGYLYRWHLPDNTLAERIALNNGYAQAYTPTAIGPDGRVYAVNNARLFSIGT